MIGDKIRYRKRKYKYQLHEDYSVDIGLKDMTCAGGFFILKTDGVLLIIAGYAWDGPSGPTFDTKDFMRGSLVHDVLYQAIRMGILPRDYKDYADMTLHNICMEDGMSPVRAAYVYEAVHLFASSSCVPGTDVTEIMEAP
jgi:hypothetical protein